MAHPPWKMWQKLHIFFQHKLRLVDKKTDGNCATSSSTIIFFINGQGLFWNRQVGIVPMRMRLIGRQIFARQVAGISMSVRLLPFPTALTLWARTFNFWQNVPHDNLRKVLFQIFDKIFLEFFMNFFSKFFRNCKFGLLPLSFELGGSFFHIMWLILSLLIYFLRFVIRVWKFF